MPMSVDISRNERRADLRGRFITVEGIEGAGKTTCLAFIRDLLSEAGKEVELTREPGGTELGEEIRALLLGHKHDGMTHDTEMLLMFAARCEHLQRRILPALRRGTWVLCDRFTDATYAYQGGGRGEPDERIRDLEQWVQQGVQPDLTLLLDLPVAIGLARAGKRSAPDRFEAERESFFERARAAYLRIAHAHPSRVHLIDASLTPDEVRLQIAPVIEGFLREHGS